MSNLENFLRQIHSQAGLQSFETSIEDNSPSSSGFYTRDPVSWRPPCISAREKQQHAERQKRLHLRRVYVPGYVERTQVDWCTCPMHFSCNIKYHPLMVIFHWGDNLVSYYHHSRTKGWYWDSSKRKSHPWFFKNLMNSEYKGNKEEMRTQRYLFLQWLLRHVTIHCLHHTPQERERKYIVFDFVKKVLLYDYDLRRVAVLDHKDK